MCLLAILFEKFGKLGPSWNIRPYLWNWDEPWMRLTGLYQRRGGIKEANLGKKSTFQNPYRNTPAKYDLPDQTY